MKPGPSLVALAFAAGAFAAGSDQPQPAAKLIFPTYTNRSDNPEVWDGVAEALKNAGHSNAIAAIRMRASAVWSAHVDLKPAIGQPPLRAIVSFDLNHWKVLCITSKDEDCSRYRC